MLFISSKTRFFRPLFRAMSSSAEEVLFSASGTARIIILNRPKALNALNLNMVRLITPKLMEWGQDSKVSHVVIRGAGEKAFCAGGDIRAVVADTEEAKDIRENFFKEEYHLNHLIGTLKKPYIALINGITMGGGVGLSVHGKFRVATERTTFAMPETAIGLFPDVGGGFFLPQLQGELGPYLALTGFRLKGADVAKAGVATHFVDAEQLQSLTDALSGVENPSEAEVGRVLDSFQDASNFSPLTPFSLAPAMADINSHFRFSTMEEIMASLQADGSPWCVRTAETLQKMSPTSMKVSLRLLREGRKLSKLADCLPIEYRLSQRCCEDHDFFEGVRAVLIDRDNQPRWKPTRLEDVTTEKMDWYFSKLEPQREWRPLIEA